MLFANVDLVIGSLRVEVVSLWSREIVTHQSMLERFQLTKITWSRFSPSSSPPVSPLSLHFTA